MSYENLMRSGLQDVGVVVFHILFEAAENWHFPFKILPKTEFEKRSEERSMAQETRPDSKRTSSEKNLVVNF